MKLHELYMHANENVVLTLYHSKRINELMYVRTCTCRVMYVQCNRFSTCSSYPACTLGTSILCQYVIEHNQTVLASSIMLA